MSSCDDNVQIFTQHALCKVHIRFACSVNSNAGTKKCGLACLSCGTEDLKPSSLICSLFTFLVFGQCLSNLFRNSSEPWKLYHWRERRLCKEFSYSVFCMLGFQSDAWVVLCNRNIAVVIMGLWEKKKNLSKAMTNPPALLMQLKWQLVFAWFMFCSFRTGELFWRAKAHISWSSGFCASLIWVLLYASRTLGMF